MKPAAEILSVLSQRQRETLYWFVSGNTTNRQIGDRMGLAERTVKNYVQMSFDVLGVWDRAGLAFAISRYPGMEQELRREFANKENQ
ncbi:response regulator transcription factor [Acidobacteria bacterium AB60]|nr:response regulator transcription factor [Acidobacteria bacterium AB60]